RRRPRWKRVADGRGRTAESPLGAAGAAGWRSLAVRAGARVGDGPVRDEALGVVLARAGYVAVLVDADPRERCLERRCCQALCPGLARGVLRNPAREIDLRHGRRRDRRLCVGEGAGAALERRWVYFEVALVGRLLHE